MFYKDYDPVFTVQTDETGRVYETDGKSFPSVTTVLGHSTKKVITQWKARVGEDVAAKITHKAGLVGNALHNACEQYVSIRHDPEAVTAFLKEQRRNPFHFSQFNKVRRFIDKNVSDVFLSEVFLYSSNIGLAGRCDLVAIYNDKKTMIDFKTSGGELIQAKIDKYALQLLAYIKMHNEIFTSEEPIVDGLIISAPGTEPIPRAIYFEGLGNNPDMMLKLRQNVAEYLDYQRRVEFFTGNS